MMQQVMAAMLGGLTTTVLINPIDIVRARLQVLFFNLLLFENCRAYFKTASYKNSKYSTVFNHSLV